MIPNDQGAEALLTNFGLLFRSTEAPAGGGPRYELVCESYFGGKVPGRVARHPDGRTLVPGLDGVYASANGCGFARAGGSTGTLEVLDLAITPSAPATVWALTREPSALHVSRDGGNSFAQQMLLPAEDHLQRIVPAPSDPAVIYLAGYGADAPLVLMVSTDGGASFATRRIPAALFARPATVTLLLGVHPTAAGTLMLAAGSPAGADEIWRSADGGQHWTRVLTLANAEVQYGFAWPMGDQVFVAGLELFVRPGIPPAHLYRSSDGGLSFPAGDIVASGESGPRYRCLEARGSRLYACAGDDRDNFLLGASDDQGRTWTPLARLGDITGSLPCAAGRCLTTAIWLCDSYGSACAGLAPRPEARDAGADAPGEGPLQQCYASDGCGRACGCDLGARRRDRAAPLIVVLLVVATVFFRRPFRRGAV